MFQKCKGATIRQMPRHRQCGLSKPPRCYDVEYCRLGRKNTGGAIRSVPACAKAESRTRPRSASQLRRQLPGNRITSRRNGPRRNHAEELCCQPHNYGAQETSGLAIASLIFGLLFFVFPAAVLAVILGHISNSQIRKSAGRLKGAGMSLAGMILGYVGIAFIPIILIIAAIAIPNLLRARMAANEASAVHSLRNIATAAVNYQSTYQHLSVGPLSARPAAQRPGPDADGAGLIDGC